MKSSDSEAKQKLELLKKVTTKVPTLENEVGTFPDRLQKIVVNGSIRAFALSAGLTPQAFHKYLKGQSEPTRPVLNAIARVANINLEWLATGTGPMMKSDATKNIALSDPVLQNFQITNLEGRQLEFKPSPSLRHLPILDLRASCGSGTFIDGEAVQAVFSATANWIRRELGANPGDLSLVFADGDSMSDTIKPEEIVIVDRSKVVRPGDGIWVFAHNDGLFIKRLQFMPNKQVEVTSDNPRYKAYSLTPDDSFRLLGRVIAALPLRKL